jgi:hypothetical protein
VRAGLRAMSGTITAEEAERLKRLARHEYGEGA